MAPTFPTEANEQNIYQMTGPKLDRNLDVG